MVSWPEEAVIIYPRTAGELRSSSVGKSSFEGFIISYLYISGISWVPVPVTRVGPALDALCYGFHFGIFVCWSCFFAWPSTWGLRSGSLPGPKFLACMLRKSVFDFACISNICFMLRRQVGSLNSRFPQVTLGCHHMVFSELWWPQGGGVESSMILATLSLPCVRTKGRCKCGPLVTTIDR